MAEERNLAVARASELPEDDETGATKEELQRRMEEARENISQTVTEIKETVVNQYQQVKNTISETLDWREHYRRRPVYFTVGAFGAGLLLGYSVRGAFGGRDDEYDYDDYETEASFDRIERGFDRMSAPRSYAAQPVLGAPPPASAKLRDVAPERSPAGEDFGAAVLRASESRHQASQSYEAPTGSPSATSGDQTAQGGQQEEESKGPGFLSRFKETKAYDRLTEEMSTLGERVVEELSRTAQTVVVPALLNKLKDMIGVDLSTQREVAQRQKLEQGAQQQQQRSGQAAGSQSASAGAGAGSTGGTATQSSR